MYRLKALWLVLLVLAERRVAVADVSGDNGDNGDTCGDTNRNTWLHHPCYPQLIEATGRHGQRVEYTVCGDEGAGEQHMVWSALDEQQCWGLSEPERKCSRSTSGQHHCLVGEQWDALRHKLGYVEAANPERVMSLEVGNWVSASTIGAIARILLEEMMNYKVKAVSRSGTFGAYERVARHDKYMTLEAWESSQYEHIVAYYVWDHVCAHPFVTNSNDKVAYSIDGEELAVQPAEELVDSTLAIHEEGLQSIPLGAFGWEGFLITSSTAIQGEAQSRMATQWQGYTATVPATQSMLHLLPADGTVKCVDRLRNGSVGDCLHPDADFYCPSDCPSSIWRESARPELACCVHGRFYPPQCIPANVTLDDIRKNPDYSSPLCREFLHPDASWNVGFMEALIVNLNLRLVVHYVGPRQMRSMLEDRTAANKTGIFYWWTPDPLISAIGAVRVWMPPASQCDSPQTQLPGPFNPAIACDKRDVPLKKLLRTRTGVEDADLKEFYYAFDMPPWEIENLLRLAKNHSTEEAACLWVQASHSRWEGWVSNANAAIPPRHKGPMSDSAKLALASIIFFATSCCFLVAVLLARSQLNRHRRHLLPWHSIELLDVISIGKLGVTFKARYLGLVVSLKPLFPPLLEEVKTQKKSGCFARCFELRASRTSRASVFSAMYSPGVPFHDMEAAAISAFASEDLWQSPVARSDGSILVSVSPEPLHVNRNGEGRDSCMSPPRTPAGAHLEKVWSSHTLSRATGSFSAKREQWAKKFKEGHQRGDFGAESKRTRSDPLPSVSVERSGSSIYNPRREMQRILEKEMAVLATIRHPNLCSFHGETTSDMGIQYAVMEFADTSLFEIIYNRTMNLESDVLISIMKNIADGMNYLHLMQPPVLHGNLKSANVLVDGNFVAKVAEFGLSSKRFVENDERVFYHAPEAQLDRQRTKAADVFSFGRMVYELLVNTCTRRGRKKTIDEWRLERVSSGRLNTEAPLELTPDQCEHADIRELVKQCQHVDPGARPSFSEIVCRLEADTTTFADRMKGFLGKQRLLDEILPPHVAEQLAAGHKAQPEHFDEVTIFFSDIVGFTGIAQYLAPEQVMCMLDELYGKFDDLVKKHDLFKVETIGDAYMCVGNLRSSQPDHAQRIARFAMDAVDAAKSTLVDKDDETRGFISIRAGFHSGPVVASVVGTTNPRYCLFGDTVNVASRMESTSKPDCIHLSDDARCALTRAAKDSAGVNEIPLVYRGNQPIKGRGSMVTFWLLGFHPGNESTHPLAQTLPARLPARR